MSCFMCWLLILIIYSHDSCPFEPIRENSCSLNSKPTHSYSFELIRENSCLINKIRVIRVLIIQYEKTISFGWHGPYLPGAFCFK
jgi:hypothetical protein